MNVLNLAQDYTIRKFKLRMKQCQFLELASSFLKSLMSNIIYVYNLFLKYLP